MANEVAPNPGPPPFYEKEFGEKWKGWLTKVYDYSIKDSETAWHYVGEAGEPAFENDWTNHLPATETPLSFRRVRICGQSFVQVRGRLDNTTTVAAGETIFTLPEGYRPELLEWSTGAGLSATAYDLGHVFVIRPTGVFQCWSPEGQAGPDHDIFIQGMFPLREDPELSA